MSKVDQDATLIKIETIALQIRGWLDWHKKSREKEFLTTDGDTAIMGLPVPMWPSHAQFEAWIKAMDDAVVVLRSAPTLIAGATYQSERGPVCYVGLDDYFGEMTHEFRQPHQRPIYVLPARLSSFLSPSPSPQKTEG